MSDTKQCPKCAETIQALATHCRYCGDEVVKGPQPVGLQVLGFILALGGLVAAIYYGAFFETAVSTPFGAVNNLGLMQDRTIGLGCGVAALVLGFVLMLVKPSKS